MPLFILQPVLFAQNVRASQTEILDLIARECDLLNPKSGTGALMRLAKGPQGNQPYLYRVQGPHVFIQARTFFQAKDPPFGLGLKIEPNSGGSRLTGRMAFAPRLWAAWWLGAALGTVVFVWMAIVTGRDLAAGRGVKGNLFWLLAPVIFLAVTFSILKVRQQMWFRRIVDLQNWFQPLVGKLKN